MKYLRFENEQGIATYGILENNMVTLLDGDLFGAYSVTDKKVGFDGLKLLTPCVPSKIIAVGKNYFDHAKEMGSEVPTVPCLFMMPPTACLSPNGVVEYPSFTSRVDYEGELAIIIKKKCKNVSKKDAFDYILGYTCLNDVTARDLQAIDGQWIRAKGIDTFAPFGPIVTDEINPDNVGVETRLNGVVVQHSNTNQFMFDIGTLMEFISQAFTLLPGDVITTGTPAGIGPMNVGDVVEVEIEGIGVLRNTIGKGK